MTAEEKAEKYFEEKAPHMGMKYTNDGIPQLEAPDICTLMADFANSQRERIFREELAKEYDSETNKELFEKEKGFYWAIFPETYAYWLIQYLKK